MSLIPDDWDGVDASVFALAVGVAIAVAATAVGYAVHGPWPQVIETKSEQQGEPNQ